MEEKFGPSMEGSYFIRCHTMKNTASLLLPALKICNRAQKVFPNDRSFSNERSLLRNGETLYIRFYRFRLTVHCILISYKKDAK